MKNFFISWLVVFVVLLLVISVVAGICYFFLFLNQSFGGFGVIIGGAFLVSFIFALLNYLDG